MGRLNIVPKPVLHIHEPLPDIEDDWGPGTSFECMCGQEWYLSNVKQNQLGWYARPIPRKIGDDGLRARYPKI